MSKTYSCPSCDNDLMPGDKSEVVCQACGKTIGVDHDFEWVGGTWRDCTHLYVKSVQPSQVLDLDEINQQIIDEGLAGSEPRDRVEGEEQ